MFFGRFLYDIAQILHLFFIERVCAFSLLQYVIEVPPKFFTNLHLGLEHHFEVERDSNFVRYINVTHIKISIMQKKQEFSQI